MLGTPLKVFFLKYNGSFSASLISMRELDSMIGTLSDWSKSIDVYEIEGLIEPAGPLTWEQCAEAVRELMAVEFVLDKCDASLQEKMEFERKLCGFTEKNYE